MVRADLPAGRWAEGRAAEFLEAGGFRILHRNFRTRFGELDLIVERDGLLVLVEVKQRSNERFSAIEETLTSAKKKKLLRAGRSAAAVYGRDRQMRFDLIALVGDPESVEIRHYTDVLNGVDL